MKTVRYPIILMDADGTLFDFDYTEKAALSYLLRRYGIADTEENHSLYRKINDGYWAQYEQGAVNKEQLQVGRFSDFFAKFQIKADWSQINHEYMEEIAKGATIYAQAEQLCKTLSPNHRLYIVTNATASTHRRRLEASPLRHYILDTFISEELGCNKPQKLFFERVFARLGDVTNKADVIILGDSLTSDMQGGRNAGIATCWYNPQKYPKDPRCDFMVTQLLDFIKIVE